MAIEELQPIGRHAERAKLIRDKIAAYHDKQRKYEIEEFEKYLSEYPGSPKGPLPSDDPEAYREYALKKIPKVLEDEIRAEELAKGMKEAEMAEDDEHLPGADDIHMGTPESYLDYMGHDRPLAEPVDDPESEDLETKDVFELSRDIDSPYMVDMKSDVPLMPNMRFSGYQAMVNHLISWQHFRNFYVERNQKTTLK